MSPDNTESALTPEQIAQRGQKIYNERLKAELEPKEQGKFVAIEVESGGYVIGDTLIEALQKAREKYPGKLFHTVRVGFEGVFKMSSYVQGGYLYAWDAGT